MNQSVSPILRLARTVAAVAAACAFTAGAALAQTTTQQPAQPPAQGGVPANQIPVVVGVLDTQAILNTSAAGKSLNTQWNAAMKALNDDMAKKESGLRAQVQQLEAKRSGNPPISAADYGKQLKALQQKDVEYQQALNKNRQGWEQRLNKARDAIAMAARKAMQEVAQQKGLTLVLDRAAVPYSPQPWNITDEVLARLNKALPNVKL